MDLSGKSVKELKDIAKSNNLSGYSKLNRKDLAKFIKSHLDPTFVEFNCTRYPGGHISTYQPYCKILPPLYIKNISGPHLFIHMKLNDQNFYLFGERHNYKSPCPGNYHNTVNFSGLIESLVKYKSSLSYDLFYEDYYDKSDTDTKRNIGSAMFDLINSTFKTCIIPKLRTECPYPNLKIHYTDFRRIEDEYFAAVTDAIYRKYEIDHMQLEHSINYILLNTERLLSHDRVLKQYKDMILYKMVYARAMAIKDNYVKTGDIYSVMVAVMDIYTLGRMLKYPDSKNIIFYAGATHTRNISELLKLVGAETVMTVKSDTDCLPLDVNAIFNKF